MRRRDVIGGALALAGCATGGGGAPARPLIIGHRGASGERPEHTRASYLRAIEEGADFIEPDLVMTRDGVLVCRHENDISETTDVAGHPEFAVRRATKMIDGETRTGWFTEDFTFAELSALRCRERLPALRPASAAFDGQEPILRFEEVLEIAAAHRVGVYPELKHPSYFAARGVDLTPPMLAALDRAGMNRRDAAVFVQCFEIGPLQRLKTLSPLRRIQLMSAEGAPADQPQRSYAEMAQNLSAIAAYADGVGVEKAMIVPRAADDASAAPTDLIARAHRAGLLVHAWTFRAENTFLPRELRSSADPAAHGDIAAELRRFFALGLDGAFTDFPGLAVAARG